MLTRLDVAGELLAGAGRLPQATDALAAARDRLAADVTAATADPRGAAVRAGARGLALRLGHALAAAVLVEHAAWTGDDADATVAALWVLRHLDGVDVAELAYRYGDLLSCGPA